MSDSAPTAASLSKLTIALLKEQLDEHGIDYASKGKLKKQDYIDLLVEHYSTLTSKEETINETETNDIEDNPPPSQSPVPPLSTVETTNEVDQEVSNVIEDAPVSEKIQVKDSQNNKMEKEEEEEEVKKDQEKSMAVEEQILKESSEMEETSTVKKNDVNDSKPTEDTKLKEGGNGLLKSNTVCISGFIRPVNVKSAKEYIISTLQNEFPIYKEEHKGRFDINEIINDHVIDIWMNSVKSSVILTFTEEEIASFCVSCISGKRWPETNLNVFQAYLYPEDVQTHRNRQTDAILQNPNDVKETQKRKRKDLMEDMIESNTHVEDEQQEEENIENNKDEMEEEIPMEIKEALRWGKPAAHKMTFKCKQRIHYCTVDAYIIKQRQEGNWIYENPYAEAYDNVPQKYRQIYRPYKRNHNRKDRKYNSSNRHQNKRQKLNNTEMKSGKFRSNQHKRGSFGGGGKRGRKY